MNKHLFMKVLLVVASVSAMVLLIHPFCLAELSKGVAR